MRPDRTRHLTSTHMGVRKLWPYLRALSAAACTSEVWVDVEEPDIVGPSVGVGFDVMGAAMIAAIDQHIADARFAEFAEGDFLRIRRDDHLRIDLQGIFS